MCKTLVIISLIQTNEQQLTEHSFYKDVKENHKIQKQNHIKPSAFSLRLFNQEEFKQTWARNVARQHCKLLNIVILSDMWADAEWHKRCMQEPSVTDSRINWIVPSNKARGPLSNNIKYAFWLFVPWNQI